MSNFADYMFNRQQSSRTIKCQVGLMLLIIGSLLTGCQKDKRPAGVLSPQELSKIMVDIYLAESRAGGQGMVKDSVMKYFTPFEKKILANAGVSDSTMRITYQYYIDRADEFEKIYDSVIDTLSLREQKARTRVLTN